MELRKALVAESAFGQMTGRAGLDENVCALDQLQESLASTGRLDVEADRTLVPVGRPEGEARIPVPVSLVERAEPSHLHTARWLNQNNVGTEVGKDLAGDRLAAVREVEDPVAGEHLLLVDSREQQSLQHVGTLHDWKRL